MATRDPKFIAEQLKGLRKLKGLKQQNLADMTGLSTRTIEKAESGTHVPSEQTLQIIARTFGLENTSFFDKPSEAALDWMRRKTVLFPIAPIRSEHDVFELFTELHPYGFDMSAVESSAAMAHAAEIIDKTSEHAEAWHDLSMAEKLNTARQFLSLCSEMEELGYVYVSGRYRQQRKLPDGRRRVVTVVVLKFLPRSETTGHSTTTLVNNWETVEEDRVELNEA